MYKIIKVLLMTFQEDEENILNAVLDTIENYCGNRIGLEQHINTKLIFDRLIIDFESRLVRRDDIEIHLTYFEFEILSLLAKNPGSVFNKEQIYDIVWKEPYSGDYNIVMSHIHNIRKKIEDDPSKPIYIQTVWGVGYRFNKNLSNSL